MDNPYSLADEDLVPDPSSTRAFEEGKLNHFSLFLELQSWNREEISRVLWSVGVLCRSEACRYWVEDLDETMASWVFIAFDTAMVWERG